DVQVSTHTETPQLFLPYRGFCARKGIHAKEVILHDLDIASAVSEFLRANSVTTIVLGASSKSALARAFRHTDVPTSVGKSAPDSCSVYVVSKGKVVKIKSASEPATPNSATKSTLQDAFSSDSPRSTKFHIHQGSWRGSSSEVSSLDGSNKNTYPLITPGESSPYGSNLPSYQNSVENNEFLHMVPWEMSHGSKNTSPLESAKTSFDSTAFSRSNYYSAQNSADREYGHKTPYNKQLEGKISALKQSVNNLNLRTNESQSGSASGSNDHSGEQSFRSDVSSDHLDQSRISDSSRSSTSSQTTEIEEELKRLKVELKQITEKYNIACQEAVTAKEKVRDIVQWKSEEGSKLEEAIESQAAALAIVERERQKSKAAVEVAHKAQRIAELESEKRKRAEMKYKQEAEEKQKAIDALTHIVVRYRKYSIDEIEVATNYFSDSEKIGEGGYGPVYKATLDHTPVAIKVLRPDLSQGQKQFQREVEVLSRMRHPHMVILLGACPDYGCLVYEYMENGSLEDRLNRLNGTPPLPWSSRFRIAAEIATALNFLHQTKPEPLVHRDLKPGNILLDKNYVSKISDVGLARLVPPSLVDGITQYHMTMTAAVGTFCYIDPEYQQTGMLGTKSDIYSLGVLFLQIITAKPPMGLIYHVGCAIENGTFARVLDQTVKDWPVEEALSFAKLALKCCELRRKDRPDLDTVILPELERLRDLGTQSKPEGRFYYMYSQGSSYYESSTSSQVSQTFVLENNKWCRFQYKDPLLKCILVLNQETRNSRYETQNQSKYGSGSGSSSTITTLESMD
ncbi:hypothetical protein RD792_015068, partial [Penstemon davidsonii]